MTHNTKSIGPIFTFILWLLLFFVICIVGISDVFADEIVNLGYVTDHTNLVLINTSFGMTSNLPVNQVSTQDFSINQIDLYISYSFSSNIVYSIELSTPNAILQNINDVSILSGDTYCSFLGLDTSNANYPNIKFTCPISANLLSVSLSNSNGNSITSTNSFRWNYSYLKQINSTIDIGPIINNQTQNTQEITKKLDEQNKTSKGIFGKLKDLFNWLTNNDDADVTGAGDVAGWLPAGPIDSIINLPLTMLNNINSSLNKTCSPLEVNLPYVNKTVEIPCLNTIFNQITGMNSFWTWVGLISSVLILYRYLIELYKYYDRLTTLQANFISDWGGV